MTRTTNMNHPSVTIDAIQRAYKEATEARINLTTYQQGDVDNNNIMRVCSICGRFIGPACEAFVKTFVDSEYTIVSPVAETVANVPFVFPANVPSDPAVVCHAGASEIVNTAEEDLTANPSVFSILI